MFKKRVTLTEGEGGERTEKKLFEIREKRKFKSSSSWKGSLRTFGGFSESLKRGTTGVGWDTRLWSVCLNFFGQVIVRGIGGPSLNSPRCLRTSRRRGHGSYYGPWYFTWCL